MSEKFQADLSTVNLPSNLNVLKFIQKNFFLPYILGNTEARPSLIGSSSGRGPSILSEPATTPNTLTS